jgi:hypothetical protein
VLQDKCRSTALFAQINGHVFQLLVLLYLCFCLVFLLYLCNQLEPPFDYHYASKHTFNHLLTFLQISLIFFMASNSQSMALLREEVVAHEVARTTSSVSPTSAPPSPSIFTDISRASSVGSHDEDDAKNVNIQEQLVTFVRSNVALVRRILGVGDNTGPWPSNESVHAPTPPARALLCSHPLSLARQQMVSQQHCSITFRM